AQSGARRSRSARAPGGRNRSRRAVPSAGSAHPGAAKTTKSGAGYHLWRPGRLRMDTGFGCGIRSATDEVPGLDLALALDRDRPPRLADEIVLEQLLRCPGDLDPPRGPVRLHPTRGIDRVAPEVVQEPLPADYAGH